MIKVSRENKKLSALLNKERERRLNTGEDVGIASLASAVGVSAEDAATALFSTTPVRSLDEAAYDDDDTATVASTVYDEDAPVREFDNLAIRFAIEKLEEQAKKIIILRYFRDFSQAETAKVLGLTQVKISREEKKILAILKKELDLLEAEMTRLKELGYERQWQVEYVKYKHLKPLVEELEVQLNEGSA